MFNAGSDGPHLLARLLKSHAGLQTAPGVQPVKVPGHDLGTKRERGPQVLSHTIKHAWRHYSNHVVGCAIQADASAHNAGISAKSAFPDAVGKNHFELSAGSVLVGRKGTTEHRFRAQDVKERRGHLTGPKLNG